MNTLADRLRTIRLEHRLTQQELADVLGLDRTSYTYYETGKTSPSAVNIIKLAKIYNVTVGYLLGVEENHPERMRGGLVTLSSGVDPISQLPREERALLMNYRLLNKEDKAEIARIIRERRD